jgi:hypothetical protein
VFYLGYTQSELLSAIGVPAAFDISPASAAYHDPGNALFECVAVGGLVLAEYCSEGCTNPANGDTCAAEGDAGIV